jgi:hypothetical protein
MKKPQPSLKIGASHESKKTRTNRLPSKDILRHKVLAGLLALPIFNSSSHSTLGTTVTFTIEDTILRQAKSELQLRGSFRIIPPRVGFTKFPFHGANGATPELELKRTLAMIST